VYMVNNITTSQPRHFKSDNPYKFIDYTYMFVKYKYKWKS